MIQSYEGKSLLSQIAETDCVITAKNDLLNLRAKLLPAAFFQDVLPQNKHFI